jgi:hypothetical protein
MNKFIKSINRIIVCNIASSMLNIIKQMLNKDIQECNNNNKHETMSALFIMRDNIDDAIIFINSYNPTKDNKN